jgi:hypothetical protein
LAHYTWKFSVYPDCSVYYLGSVDNNPFNETFPYPVNCNLTTSTPSSIIENSIFLFPNPTSDYISLVLPIDFTNAEIDIFDILGELEYSSTTTVQKTEINTSTMTKGVHLIQITTADNVIRQKFIKK